MHIVDPERDGALSWWEQVNKAWQLLALRASEMEQRSIKPQSLAPSSMRLEKCPSWKQNQFRDVHITTDRFERRFVVNMLSRSIHADQVSSYPNRNRTFGGGVGGVGTKRGKRST